MGLGGDSMSPGAGVQTQEILLADSFKKRVLRVPTVTIDDLLSRILYAGFIIHV